jgi:hypothetical protein
MKDNALREQVADIIYCTGKSFRGMNKEEIKVNVLRSTEQILSLFQPMDEEEIEKIVQENLLPFADAEWRTDKFKFDERAIKQFSRMIALSLSNKISGAEKEYCKCKIYFEPGKSVLVEKVNPPICANCHKEIRMQSPQPQNNIEEKPAKIERLDENKKHYLGDIYKKLNKVIDAINEIRGRG